MGKPLDATEYYARWALALTVIAALLVGLYKFIKKSILYIIKSNERFEMLQTIIENQEYDKVERQAIMDKISLGYFRTDLEGRSIEIGDVVCKIFGKTEDELLKFNWSSFIHPDDRDWVMHSIMEDLKYKRNGDLKYRIINSSDEVLKVHVTARRNAAGYFCILQVIK